MGDKPRRANSSNFLLMILHYVLGKKYGFYYFIFFDLAGWLPALVAW
jgi:hypothetical protein